MELTCAIQNYEWGKKGQQSIVATLTQNVASIKNTTPYAELWLGTHPSGPSTLKNTKESLLAYIKKNPQQHLGPKVTKMFGNDLPYLLKVLSIENPLSIQAHPDKKLAKKLFASRPDVYKDPNHKPELAIALGDFQALCGFRPFAEIKSLAKELSHVLLPLYGSESFKRLQTGSESQETVKACFNHLLRQNKEDIKMHVDTFVTEVDAGAECIDGVCMHKPGSYKNGKWLATHHIQLLKKLNNLYPGDPGCLSIYLLNVINLKRFDAIFLAANVPHAYISGDCIEVMACSDNVIRAGLTPKYIDIETLIDMLDYSSRDAKSLMFSSTMEDAYTQIFRPPVEDFAIAKIQIPKGSKHVLINRPTASIVLILEGQGAIVDKKVVKNGMSFFLSANEAFNIISVQTDLLIFQAMANL